MVFAFHRTVAYQVVRRLRVFLANMSPGIRTPMDGVMRQSGSALLLAIDEGAPDHAARVLVADGNVINQKAAVHMLESLGVRADVSANGPEAVAALLRSSYDLVLLDCQMPFSNGLDAAIEIRRSESPLRRTPIIAMTAEAGADCLDDCLASGVDDILLKPVRLEMLAATLRRWIPAIAVYHEGTRQEGTRQPRYEH